MNVILINLSLTISRGQQIKGLPDVFNEVFSLGRIGRVSIPVLIAIAVVICMYVVLYWTRLGRRFYALGGNPEAAYVSGIRFGPYSFYAFTLCGLLVGVGGVLLTARALAGMPLLGAGLGLESIAAAVIGGISIFGGKGHLVGAVFGAIFFILLRNGMDLMGVGSYPQGIATGAILIMALIMDVYRRS
jgi:ribose transport system permease protein